MVKRADGYFDIVDLKTANLKNRPITVRSRKRRGFSHTVEDGFSQLVNYREYFTFKSNAEYARNQFGVTVNNPNLYLVIGNRENFIHEKVEQAMRRNQGTGIRIVDFDFIVSKMLTKKQ